MWDETALLVWSASVGAIAAAAWWWTATAWSGVVVEAEFTPARAFVDEPTHLRIRITNPRRRPLPIVRVETELPERLDPAGEDDPTAMRGYRRRIRVGARSEATLLLPLQARGRGEYWLGSLEVSLSDALDIVRVARRFDTSGPLLVMPSPRIGVPLRIKRWLPFGTPASGARLFEDREHFAGVRDYVPGDPMHHVHWRLSAHAGGLQTKRFEPTRSAEVLFALDLSRGEPFWRAVSPEAAEDVIGWTSLLARQAISAGWRTGLVANTHMRRGRGPMRVPSATSAGQEAALFTALARMPAQPTNDLAPVLREEGRRLARRTTIVVISADPGDSLLHEIEVLKRRGADVVHLSPDHIGGGP